jgi:leucyl aminopeptidase
MGKAAAGVALRVSDRAKAITEGALLGSYHYTVYHGEETMAEHEKRRAEAITILAPDAASAKQIEAGIAEGRTSAGATIFARDLVNTPASDMTPKHLVEIAKDIAKKSKRISLEVFDAAEAKRRGMGAFLAVAKGSEEPSYFIHLSYKPPHFANASQGKHTKIKKLQATSHKLKRVFLVGKGITFDSGGLSLKTSKHMESMKTDMAGGAAVLAVFRELDALAPRAEVHGVVPVTENMPSGKATKPGDIARAMNGKTIEILNTDAEGRLILADALAFAVQQKADAVVDLATLTGSCIEALGQEVAGLFGNNRQLAKQLMTAAEAAGEYVWELPLVKEYQSLIKSKAADLKNITGGGVGAGSITAALFLKEFVGTTPWAHLDIAGPAWAERETFASVPIGGTGFGVRTLIEFLEKQR